MILAPPYNIKFKGIYVSVWFDKWINFYCKKGAQGYYISLVFSKYKTLNEIKEYINNRILKTYSAKLLNHQKAIHVKYFYEVINNKGKYMEIWVEHNYDGNKWNTICEWDSDNKKYKLAQGFKLYKYIPYRLVGSLFTLNYIILKSDYIYQYLLKEKIN